MSRGLAVGDYIGLVQAEIARYEQHFSNPYCDLEEEYFAAWSDSELQAHAAEMKYKSQREIYVRTMHLLRLDAVGARVKFEFIPKLMASVSFLLSQEFTVRSIPGIYDSLPVNFIKAYVLVGHVFFDEGHYSEAISYYREGLLNKDCQNDTLLVGRTLSIFDKVDQRLRNGGFSHADSKALVFGILSPALFIVDGRSSDFGQSKMYCEDVCAQLGFDNA
ncbi:MAG: hypothetical protein COB66_04370 [Coxiella sp. (in: Bacteria)]|nr:MAG: hypothetical protein COB66_04370 [Coxiella sp. (in: g-proteobacteria)]